MRRVLIVDDEPFISMEIEEAVKAGGFAIAAVVHTLESAVEAVGQRQCDLAVIDANLRGESAAPLALALQAAGIPFVVVSGYARAQIAWLRPDTPYLDKPFANETLIEFLHRLTPAPPTSAAPGTGCPGCPVVE